jgi:hypothetical protein
MLSPLVNTQQAKPEAEDNKDVLYIFVFFKKVRIQEMGTDTRKTKRLVCRRKARLHISVDARWAVTEMCSLDLSWQTKLFTLHWSCAQAMLAGCLKCSEGLVNNDSSWSHLRAMSTALRLVGVPSKAELGCNRT